MEVDTDGVVGREGLSYAGGSVYLSSSSSSDSNWAPSYEIK